MAAYVIVEMAVTDPIAIEEYRRLAGASVAQYGGRFTRTRMVLVEGLA